MPLGLRVFRKVENIIRDEMNKSDAIEVMMPFVTPAGFMDKKWQMGYIWKRAIKIKR